MEQIENIYVEPTQAVKEPGPFEDASTVHFDGLEGVDLLQGFEESDTADVSTNDGPENTPEDGVGQEGQEEKAEAEAEAESEALTTEQTGDDSKLTFRAKIDHQEQDVSIERDALPTIYQKAANMDRAVQRAESAQQETRGIRDRMEEIAAQARALGYTGDTADDAIEAMLAGVRESAREARVTELTEKGVDQEVAEFMAEQQLRNAEADQGPKKAAEAPEAPSQAPDGSGEEGTEQEPATEGGNVPTPEQFSQDLHPLLAMRPELKRSDTPFPDEVLKAYMQGENLTVAYLDYESRQAAAQKEALLQRNRMLEQSERVRGQAPVTGVSGGGGTGGQEDPWLSGFDDPYW